MWENPRENAMAGRPSSDLEAWAHREAKSEAMVAEVLERAGAETLSESAEGRFVRGLAATVAALAYAAVIGGSLWLALSRPVRDAGRDSRLETDPSWTTAADGRPRFGPFHP